METDGNATERASMIGDGRREEATNGERRAADVARDGAIRRKLTVHVAGALATVLVLYVLSIPLASLRMTAKVDEEVEETSRLLVSLSTAKWDGNDTHAASDAYNRGDRVDARLSHAVRAEMERTEVNVGLRCPLGAVIAGPSGSGKSVLMEELIGKSDEMCDRPPTEIIYCYGSWQPAFERMRNVTFHEGLIDFERRLPSDGEHRWLIIDDLMSESSGNREVEDLFTKHSHHKNVSVFVLVQNFFHSGFRTITLNAHYLFLFKNPRDASQISFLARQLFPENPKFLIESYRDATAKPHSFLTLDLKQDTPDDYRVLGNFLPSDPSEPIVVYSPK
jgi:hypothetical protein